MDSLISERVSGVFGILLFLFVTGIGFYLFWVKPSRGTDLLQKMAPWLNNSLEGYIYRIGILLLFIFALGLSIFMTIDLLFTH